MFVSILQRFMLALLPRAAEPLQSRADQNTRKVKSGGPPDQKPAGKVDSRVKVAVESGQLADPPGNLASARAELPHSSLARKPPQGPEGHPEAASQRRHIVKAQDSAQASGQSRRESQTSAQSRRQDRG